MPREQTADGLGHTKPASASRGRFRKLRFTWACANVNPNSAKTLVWASVISVSLGTVVMSPVGSVFLYALAALAALIAILGGGRRLRIASALILAASLVLLAVTYPKYDIEMKRYKERAQQKSS